MELTVAHHVSSAGWFIIFSWFKNIPKYVTILDIILISFYIMKIYTPLLPRGSAEHKAASFCRFLPQRRAFCSHHEIPPRRPQTSISVFPRELPPGARGQSAASCQPRNVTSPLPHTHKHTHLLHTQPPGCLPAPEHSTIYFASPKEGTHAKWIREKTLSMCM